MSDVVLDASALLAAINNEPGGERVKPLLRRALVSSVNLSETAAVLLAIGVAATTVRSGLSQLGVTTVPFDDALAFAAADLRPLTRPAGLSFGDRACLALALQRQLPVLTADRAWTRVGLGLEVRLIR